jgi:hypothetical protein
MTTTKHTAEIRICADDIRGDHAARKFADALCDVIRKAEGTIKANACRLHKYTIDNTPSMDQNPSGDIVTITFYIESDFAAEGMKLDVDFVSARPCDDIFAKTKDATIVNLRYKR